MYVHDHDNVLRRAADYRSTFVNEVTMRLTRHMSVKACGLASESGT
jgi:hypothetical protein